jgi:hypothetical protein
MDLLGEAKFGHGNTPVSLKDKINDSDVQKIIQMKKLKNELKNQQKVNNNV